MRGDGTARGMGLRDRAGCWEGRMHFHKNDRSQGSKEQHRSDSRAHPPAAGVGQTAQAGWTGQNLVRKIEGSRGTVNQYLGG